MKRSLFLLPWLGMLCAAQDLRQVGEQRTWQELPAEGAAWVEPGSGLLVPQRLGGFVMSGGYTWKDPKLGTSVRLEHEKARARADLFVYPCAAPAATEAERRGAVEGELRQSVGTVFAMQERGSYSKVNARNGSFGEIDLLPKGSLPFAWTIVTMTLHQRTPAGDAPEEVTSWHAVTVFNGHFVKVRYTFPSAEGEAGEKVLNEFVEAWQWCLREPGFRAMIRPSVRTYLSDPLSPKAAEAAGAVLTYAEKTAFVSLPLGERLSLCMQEAEAAGKGAELDILRAFVTGSVDASLRSQKPAEPEAGAAQVARVYGLLKAKHAGFQSPALEALAEAVKAGRAGPWLEEKGALKAAPKR
ncbi:MAG: hypothetical protein HS117_26645 [Verrucomicrobiaceae bacterium]|nr:hypothetical protein [Verrucomicrobiaceae bacterium]